MTGIELWGGLTILAGLMVLPMALPLVATVTGIAQSAVGDTGDWFDWPLKLIWLLSVLRERWLPYDLACTAGLLTLAGPWLVHAPVLHDALAALGCRSLTT